MKYIKTLKKGENQYSNITNSKIFICLWEKETFYEKRKKVINVFYGFLYSPWKL